MASLVLPPDHHKFPATPVLHAICALASAYTGIVTSAPAADYTKVPLDELFTQKYRRDKELETSFADQQAQLAKETARQLEVVGADLLQVVQANVLLAWYYCSNARYGELFMTTAQALRLSVPLNLNVCPPFHSISISSTPEVLPGARTVVDDETRRNTFWLAYAIERCHGSSNGWAQCLDDQDIFQLLPVRQDQFENGEFVSHIGRQWAHSHNLLLTHPDSQVDAFVLYVKSTILVSKVKTFNLRCRARHVAGEESITSVETGLDQPVDLRKTLSFIELDRIVSEFLSTFPPSLRHPIQQGTVDCNLTVALALPHLTTIILHEPHANLGRDQCVSAHRTLSAARAIVDLIYELWSTSFDLSLLESFTAACFFHAGRVLASFLRAVSEKSLAWTEHASDLQSQIIACRTACEQMGQRHSIAVRFTATLDVSLERALNVGTVPSGAGEEMSLFELP
ncbi:hypothetical protein PQX77_004185 [Marasmius sp. AFHP31]|nr:hypothetical protein PQX77_004185 [Marasmius sp. AFHP31]